MGWDKVNYQKIYNCIHPENFIYSLRESEYRRNIRKLKKLEKLDDFAKIIASVDTENLINEDNLMDINYDICYDD